MQVVDFNGCGGDELAGDDFTPARLDRGAVRDAGHLGCRGWTQLRLRQDDRGSGTDPVVDQPIDRPQQRERDAAAVVVRDFQVDASPLVPGPLGRFGEFVGIAALLPTMRPPSLSTT